MGSAALAAAVALPGYGHPMFSQGFFLLFYFKSNRNIFLLYESEYLSLAAAVALP